MCTDALSAVVAYRSVKAVLPAVLRQIENLVGRRFSFDARAMRAGFDPLCNLFTTSGRSLSSAELGGHTVFFTPSSLRELQLQMHSYYACKQRRPDTSAAVLLPAFASRKASQLLRGMKRILVFPVGTQLFNGVALSGQPVLLPGLPYSAEVWFDSPSRYHPVEAAPVMSNISSPVFASTTGGHLPLITTRASGLSLSTLLDTGASHDFISATTAKSLGLRIQSSKWSQVTLADGGKQSILGRATLRLSIGPLRLAVNPYVLPMLTDTASYILGSETLQKYSAVINYQTQQVSLRKGTLVCRVPLSISSEPPDSQTPLHVNFALTAICKQTEPESIGRKEATRLLRRGAHALLVRPKLSLNSVTSDSATAKDHPQLQALLHEYADIFQEVPGLPPMRPVDHTIPLIPGSQPVSRPMYRLSPLELEEVKRQVTDLLKKGMIRPSTSPYSAPILFVGKKDGSLRMCIDYRGLNATTVKNRYPLPRVDDLLDKLKGASYFSSIDLQQGYNQIRISETDIPKSAFRTPFGHYEYTVLSFGLANAPATFQAVMDRIFRPHIDKFVICYLDDILVYSKTLEEHLQHLRVVLDVLRQQQLYAKSSKCHWAQPQIEYLGHIVSADGVRMDPKKVASVRDWPVPNNLQELRRFLGLTNYFRKFIDRYSMTAAPLTNLTRKGAFLSPDAWSPDCQLAFDTLKRAVGQDMVLRFPDFSLPFRVEVVTDASLDGLGAVLLQQGRPVAFMSKKLTSAERNYHTGEQELLAVVQALRDWRCYLEGQPFVVKTDHKPLTFLQGVPTLSRRQARWLEYMARFNFTWEHCAGSLNVADALSRHPSLHAAILSLVSVQSVCLICASASPCASVATRRSAATQERGRPNESAKPTHSAEVVVPDLVNSDPVLLERLRQATAKDPWYSVPLNVEHLRTAQGLFFRTDGDHQQIVVPDDIALRQCLLFRLHNGPLAGHPGSTRMTEVVRRHFWWPRLARDVEDYVRTCSDCQRNKAQSGKTPGLLQPLPVPNAPWDSVSLDFIVALPKSEGGYDAILVMVDRLTKMVHLAPTTTTCTAERTARLFFDNVVRLHGVPKNVVSDRGPQFGGKFWGALGTLLNMRVNLSTAYHPQTDGQTERVNRTLGDMLRNFVTRSPAAWDTYLSAAEFAMNNAVNRSTNHSPFFLNYGFNPALPIWRELDLPVPAAKVFAKSFVSRIEEAKSYLDAAQQRAKLYYDVKRKDLTLKPGQLIMLSTRHLRGQLTNPRKLLPRWVGPYPVLRIIGSVAVEIQLPPEFRIHNTFHISLLRPYHGKVPESPVEPGPIAYENNDALYSVERILDYRVRRIRAGRRYRNVREYFVKWAGYTSEHNSWEPEKNFTPDLTDALFAARNAAGTQHPEGG